MVELICYRCIKKIYSYIPMSRLLVLLESVMGKIMETIVEKVKALLDELAYKRPHMRKPLADVDEMENQVCTGQTLYDHRIITIEEDVINRMLRNRFRDHWLLHSVTFEFEPNNLIFIGIITKMGQVINANFVLEDLWFDDYSSSFQIKLDIGSIDTGGFILNSFVHLLGKWLMSLIGTFFNPFSLGEEGSTMRLDKNGVIRFDLIANSDIRHFIPFPERHIEDNRGPILLANAKTIRSVLHLDYYAFNEEVDTFTAADIPVKTSWFRSIDIAAVLLLPLGVWISFVILHHYLPAETIEFSFSTYFLISLGILCISFFVMNIPRYIYMYFDNRKRWQSAFVHNNIKIQMRKLHRRIVTQQTALEADGGLLDVNCQEKIKTLLLQIRDKRFLVQRLKLADEDRDRKQKVKFIIAYIVCTLLEWVLLIS